MSRPAEGRTDTPVLITMGEPSGIGPEVAVKPLLALSGSCGNRPLRLVGPADIFREHGDIPEAAFWPMDPASCGNPVIQSIDVAVSAALAGQAGAVVTAPIAKSKLLETGFPFPGHTEYLAKLTGTSRPV